MIWYDIVTKTPVAPGACEDSGAPSIVAYYCVGCSNDVEPSWELGEVEVEETIIQFGMGVCPRCGFVMLTTLL